MSVIFIVNFSTKDFFYSVEGNIAPHHEGLPEQVFDQIVNLHKDG